MVKNSQMPRFGSRDEAKHIALITSLGEEIASLITRRAIAAGIDDQIIGAGIAAGSLMTAAQHIDGTTFQRPGITGSLLDVLLRWQTRYIVSQAQQEARGDPMKFKQAADRMAGEAAAMGRFPARPIEEFEKEYPEIEFAKPGPKTDMVVDAYASPHAPRPAEDRPSYGEPASRSVDDPQFELAVEGQQVTCSMCGHPMPKGEEMFQYHGFSGPCPEPLKIAQDEMMASAAAKARRDQGFVVKETHLGEWGEVKPWPEGEPDPEIAHIEPPAPDWRPQRSAVGLPEGERARGSTGQLFEVQRGQWARVREAMFECHSCGADLSIGGHDARCTADALTERSPR